MLLSEQASTVRVMAPVYQQPLQHFAHQPLSSQKPVDLSCHEMDVSMDTATVPAEHQNIDYTMEDSQGTENTYCYHET